MTDINTRRLLDRIDLLERANAQQLIQIETYRRKNVRLTRENSKYAAEVGKMSLPATQQAKNRGRA